MEISNSDNSLHRVYQFLLFNSNHLQMTNLLFAPQGVNPDFIPTKRGQIIVAFIELILIICVSQCFDSNNKSTIPQSMYNSKTQLLHVLALFNPSGSVE
jgi:hypothetical protein